jgi:small subunit ribosomal protein S4
LARYSDSVCRLCRREGLKLFLKGDRCYSERCAFERRAYPPGQEKQKVKRMYGLLERQFRLAFQKAERMKGITGENLLLLLERRLDNIVFRMGFAQTRTEARQLVRHGHFMVNGGKVDIPSYQVKEGDSVQLRDRSQKIARIGESLQTVVRRGIPGWVEIDAKTFTGTVKALPRREDLTMPIQEQLIVELYSK